MGRMLFDHGGHPYDQVEPRFYLRTKIRLYTLVDIFLEITGSHMTRVTVGKLLLQWSNIDFLLYNKTSPGELEHSRDAVTA